MIQNWRSLLWRRGECSEGSERSALSVPCGHHLRVQGTEPPREHVAEHPRDRGKGLHSGDVEDVGIVTDDILGFSEGQGWICALEGMREGKEGKDVQ